MASYIVKGGGERLDRIAKQLYGTEQNGTVEALLEANPGLAALGPIVPEATIITVPAEVETKPVVDWQLAWD